MEGEGRLQQVECCRAGTGPGGPEGEKICNLPGSLAGVACVAGNACRV